mgnify:CR=1 FL=1
MEKLKAGFTDTIYKKDIRPLHSTATTQALGLGSRYEIDATIADVILVSDHDRNQPVGRPTVYIVIDVRIVIPPNVYGNGNHPPKTITTPQLHVITKKYRQSLKPLELKFNSYRCRAWLTRTSPAWAASDDTLLVEQIIHFQVDAGGLSEEKMGS